MAERWFLALWPDSETRAALAAQVARFAPLPGRSTHPLDWHLTLVFLGELEPERLSCVEEAAAGIQAPAFAFDLERIDHFARSQVLWCGPARTPEPLAELVADLQERLVICGMVPESRPYRPHVTLARKARVPVAHEFAAPVRWPVTEWVLAHGGTGTVPRYRVSRRFKPRSVVR